MWSSEKTLSLVANKIKKIVLIYTYKQYEIDNCLKKLMQTMIRFNRQRRYKNKCVKKRTFKIAIYITLKASNETELLMYSLYGWTHYIDLVILAVATTLFFYKSVTAPPSMSGCFRLVVGWSLLCFPGSAEAGLS